MKVIAALSLTLALGSPLPSTLTNISDQFTPTDPQPQPLTTCTYDVGVNWQGTNVSNIQCRNGAVRAWAGYYKSDNDPRLWKSYGPWRSSHSSYAKRPAGTIFAGGGAEEA